MRSLGSPSTPKNQKCQITLRLGHPFLSTCLHGLFSTRVKVLGDTIRVSWRREFQGWERGAIEGKAGGQTKTLGHTCGLGKRHLLAIRNRQLQRHLGLCRASGARDVGRGVVVGDPQASIPGTLYRMTPVLWSLAPESQLPYPRS